MAENEIRVVITGVASDLRRALEGAKGDLGGLKAAIKDVPNQVKIDVQAQTAAAAARLTELRRLAKDVPNRINIRADADTGIASAKLRLLEAQARDTETAIARASLGSLISGGGGGGLLSAFGSAGVNPFGGGTASLVAGGSPAIAAGIGSATAVAGSAGAAALGAGALGTAALGAGGVGLGSMLAVLVPAKTAISNVTTAMGALELAQAKYGAGSKQAATAQKGLNAVVADSGPLALTIAKQLQAISDLWQQVSAPATKALYQIIVPGLKLVKELMPTVAGIAKTAFDAIGRALDPVFKGLSSPAFKRVLTDLGDAFAKLAAPAIGAFSNLMRAFFNVAVAASPFLINIANAFERWTKSFADSLSPGAHLNALIGGLVSQLRSWWQLATSLGSLMITIFSAGAGTGQSLVNLLTGIVRQWNAWLNTKAGQEALTTFFKNSATLVKALVSALAPLIGALVKLAIDLMPTFTQVVKAITPVFNLAAGAISKVADALGSKLTQAVAVAAIVFLPGGPLILGLVALGDIISHLPEIIHALRDAWRAVWDAMKIAFERSLSFILGGISSLLGAIKFMVDNANIKIPGLGRLFGSFGTDASRGLGKAQDAIDQYRQHLDGSADKAKTDLGRIGDYHETARDRVVQATRDMISHVDTGIVTVDSDLGKELKKLGVTVQQVLIGASQHPLQSKPAFAHAGGGLVQIGRAGEKGRDRIPMSVGGHDIMVGAGEQAAIFNSEQQQVMNSRLADIGGLPGLFSKHNRPHYMAGGGLVGNVGAMIAEANRVDSKHFPYVWGGGHGSFAGPYDCSGAVSDILHAGGVLNAPRVSGDFMSYGLPGPGAVTLYANPTHVYMSIDGKFFGTSGSNPGGGAGWFDGAPRPGFVQRHVGGSVDSIKQPPWTGPAGLLGGTGRQSVKLATQAANQTLSKAMAQSFSGAFGGGDWGSSGPVAREIFDAFTALGYDKVAIAGIIGNASQESGLGSTSRNIFQFTPPIPGSSGPVATQAQLVAARGGPALRRLMNASTSPADAAARFMNSFEKPLASAANLPNRIAGAVQAFGQGYATGGIAHPKHAHVTTPAMTFIAMQEGLGILGTVNHLLGDISTAQRDYGAWSTYYAATDPGGLTPGEIGQLVGYDKRQLADLWTLGATIPKLLAAAKQTPALGSHFNITSMRDTLAGLGDQALGVKADIINLQRPGATATSSAGSAAASAPGGPDLAALNALLATELSNTRTALAVSQSQFGVFAGFEPLLAGRLVGSFQSGVDFVPRTGVALVHRGETIIPDPSGPQGNRAAAATVHTAQGPIEIVINMGNNDVPLMKVIDARMNQKALQITSDHSGQRARLLSGVRRP